MCISSKGSYIGGRVGSLSSGENTLIAGAV
jgi:hypothetical protein